MCPRLAPRGLVGGACRPHSLWGSGLRSAGPGRKAALWRCGGPPEPGVGTGTGCSLGTAGCYWELHTASFVRAAVSPVSSRPGQRGIVHPPAPLPEGSGPGASGWEQKRVGAEADWGGTEPHPAPALRAHLCCGPRRRRPLLRHQRGPILGLPGLQCHGGECDLPTCPREGVRSRAQPLPPRAGLALDVGREAQGGVGATLGCGWRQVETRLFWVEEAVLPSGCRAPGVGRVIGQRPHGAGGAAWRGAREGTG